MVGSVELLETALDVRQANARVILEAPPYRQADPVVFHLEDHAVCQALCSDVHLTAPQQRARPVTDRVLDERLQDEARHERVTRAVLDPDVDRQPILEPEPLEL